MECRQDREILSGAAAAVAAAAMPGAADAIQPKDTPTVEPAEKPEASKPDTYAYTQAILVCTFVASTGFFHGYDNGVVNDVFTMPSFRAMMGWPEEDDARTALHEGLTVNGFNAGAAVSAVLAGHLIVDKYGRKPALILGSLLFGLGGVVQCLAVGAWMLILGRLIAGVGVGITSAAGPAYIAEVAPEKIRGAMVGIYQSNICVAILGAAVLNYADHDVSFGWQVSLGVQVVLGFSVAFGLIFMSETPRFLEQQGRSEEALRILTKLRGSNRELAAKELESVRAEIKEEEKAGEASWSEVFTNPFFRNVIIIGCLMQFFQIITGINAMVSFSGTLFKHLGVGGLEACVLPFAAFLLGNAIGGFVLVDRIGRRSLLIWGMLGMSVTLITGGIVALAADKHLDADGHEVIDETAGMVIIGTVVLFLFSFGISWGFGAWLYISEIMPLRVRGKAVGLCTGINWGPANVASAFITPQMINSPMGPGGTLLFFGFVSLLVIPFAATCLPETKGKTLEEVAPLFRFSSWAGFRNFVRGNLRGGLGCTYEAADKGAGAAKP